MGRTAFELLNAFYEWSGHTAFTLALLLLVMGPRPLRPPFTLQACIRWMVWLDAAATLTYYVVQGFVEADMADSRFFCFADVLWAFKDGAKYGYLMHRCGFHVHIARGAFFMSVFLYCAFMVAAYSGAKKTVTDGFFLALYVYWTIVDMTSAWVMGVRLRRLSQLFRAIDMPSEERRAYDPIVQREEVRIFFSSIGMMTVTVLAIFRTLGWSVPFWIPVLEYSQVVLAASALVPVVGVPQRPFPSSVKKLSKTTAQTQPISSDAETNPLTKHGAEKGNEIGPGGTSGGGVVAIPLDTFGEEETVWVPSTEVEARGTDCITASYR